MRQVHGLAGNAVGHARRRHRQIEDVIVMDVLDRAVMRELAVEPARRDHRDLVREVDEPLDDRFLVADQPPDALAVFDAIDAVLALAVVTERGGLDDRRQARSSRDRSRARRATAPWRTA